MHYEPGVQIPHLQRIVARRGNGLRPVRRHGHPIDFRRVAFQSPLRSNGGPWRAGIGNVPNHQCVVCRRRDHSFATLEVWDLDTDGFLCMLEGHSDWVNGVAASPRDNGPLRPSPIWELAIEQR